MNANELCDIQPSIPPHLQSIHFHSIVQLLLWQWRAALRTNSFTEYGALLQPFLSTYRTLYVCRNGLRGGSQSPHNVFRVELNLILHRVISITACCVCETKPMKFAFTDKFSLRYLTEKKY